MIVTRAPFRVTLAGGGTDLPSYYSKHGGFIYSMAITHYMYVMTNPPTVDRKVRIHYSKSECVDNVSELEHELAREALRYHGIEDKMEISSMADLPSGTGLGSSSSYLIALLMALHHYRRDYVSMSQLAEEACDIELRILGKGIGKQDQYMASFGGLTRLDIDRDGSVSVSHTDLSLTAINELASNTHLYYTGLRRDAPDVLADQNMAMLNPGSINSKDVEKNLNMIKDLGYRIYDAIIAEDFDKWGELTHEHWVLKKGLSKKISLTVVDLIYEEVRNNFNVLGGKIVGAGGGGFLLLYCNKNHKKLENYMLSQGMPRLHYSIDTDGCKVLASFASHRVFDDQLGPKGKFI
jgi:D-glycero-alpha-D-manno-heptose-7-phosphate kinase